MRTLQTFGLSLCSLQSFYFNRYPINLIKNMKKYLLKYALEFLVIVMGISVSFWLNEISVEKNENRERLKVLNNIKTEIKDIQKYTGDRMKYWQDDIDLYSMFLNPEFEINSIEEEEDEAIRKAIKNNGSDISKAAHGVVESIPSFIGFVKTGPKVALKLTKKYGPEIAKKMLKDKRNFNKASYYKLFKYKYVSSI